MRATDFSSLQNKTIVITGASSGVGRAAAIAFAKHKATLILAARGEKALYEAAEECREWGADAIAVVTDVTNANDVKKLAQAAAEQGGKIDVWINNAAVLAAGDFDKTPVQVHTQVIETNLIGYVHGAHAAMPYFKKQGYGTLINKHIDWRLSAGSVWCWLLSKQVWHPRFFRSVARRIIDV